MPPFEPLLKTGDAFCAPGERIVSGGYFRSAGDPAAFTVPTNIFASYPNLALQNASGQTVQGWSVRGGIDVVAMFGHFKVYAVCAM